MKNILYTILLINFILIKHNLDAQVPESGLIAYYPFSNNAKDRSGNCINGTIYGANLTSDRFNYNNAAFHFDGTGNDYIEIPGSIFENPEYTYSVWASAESIPLAGDSYGIISVGGIDFRDQTIGLRNDGYGSASYNNDLSNFVLYSQKPPIIGQWTHIVSIRSTDKIQLYLDGILVDEQKVSNFLTPFYSANLKTTIGIRHNYQNPFHGILDDVRFYDRALSSEEVMDLYKEHICFESLSVTDTLVINANITSYSPINYNINIKVYPNPSFDHLIIESSDITNLIGYTIKISNSSGVEVFQSLFDKQVFDLDMKKWKGKGIYFINIYDSNSNLIDVKKIILQ